MNKTYDFCIPTLTCGNCRYQCVKPTLRARSLDGLTVFS
jgi:hypothetical protein